MAVRHRKSGAWRFYYRKHGQLFVEDFKGRGAEARARARDARHKAERAAGKSAMAVSSMTFTRLVNAYLGARFKLIRPSTKRMFMLKMENIILPKLGHMHPLMITRGIMADFITFRLQDVSPRTVGRDIADIQAVLNWAAETELIAHNPIAGMKRPKFKRHEFRPPDRKEVESILVHAKEHVKRAILIMYYLGTRPGQCETFSLKWMDCDFKSKEMRVESAEKGGIDVRYNPIRPDLMRHLKKWYLADGQNSAGNIVHYHGKPVKSIKKAFATAKDDAGIKRNLRLYDFRHAFATNALKAGADPKAVAYCLGHKQESTTREHYQFVDSDLKKETVDLLPRVAVKTKKGKVIKKRKAV